MGPQCCDLTFEVLSGAEPAIHRGKAQVRDLIQVTQRAKDGQAHLIAGNFRGSSRPDGILDLLGQQVQRIIIDITTLTGPPYALDDLVATKRLSDPAALHDGQHGGLDGGETAAALGARAPASYRLTLVRLTGIDKARVRMTAERTVHYCSFAGSGLYVVGLG